MFEAPRHDAAAEDAANGGLRAADKVLRNVHYGFDECRVEQARRPSSSVDVATQDEFELFRSLKADDWDCRREP